MKPFRRASDLLLKFKEFMWRHLVRTLGNRGSTGFQVDEKLDFSDRGYSWQFFWEDVEKFTNNRDVLDSFKGVAFKVFNA